MRRFKTSYLIATNTAALIVAVQLAAHAAVLSYHWLARHGLYEPPSQRVLDQSADMPRTEFVELWPLTSAAPLRFGGGAGFVHAAIASTHVNVIDSEFAPTESPVVQYRASMARPGFLAAAQRLASGYAIRTPFRRSSRE